MAGPETIQIREALVQDAAALCRLYEELAEGRREAMPASETQAASLLADIGRQSNRCLLVAEMGGAIVGTMDLLIVPNLTHHGQPWAIIENVVVATSQRRRGIARTLMEEVMRRAREAGCYKVQLMSGKQRVEAHEFYRALGFQAVAEGFRAYAEQGVQPTAAARKA